MGQQTVSEWSSCGGQELEKLQLEPQPTLFVDWILHKATQLQY